MGLPVRAALGGGSGGVLPHGPGVGRGEWGPNSNLRAPASVCTGVEMWCIHFRGPKTPESVAAAHMSKLGSAPSPTHFWSPATTTSLCSEFLKCSSLPPSQGLCCFPCSPYHPCTGNHCFLGEVPPATPPLRLLSLCSASHTPGAFLHHPNMVCPSVCV